MPRLIEILLVEDSEDDIVLTQKALTEERVANRLSIARDGEDALAFLRRQSPHEGKARPDLILLDLNLPRMDGHEVLVEIKNDPLLAAIPVVVLTTSKAEADVVQAYDAHANSYVRKPLDFEAFLTVVRSIDDYWLGIVSLP